MRIKGCKCYDLCLVHIKQCKSGVNNYSVTFHVYCTFEQCKSGVNNFHLCALQLLPHMKAPSYNQHLDNKVEKTEIYIYSRQKKYIFTADKKIYIYSRQKIYIFTAEKRYIYLQQTKKYIYRRPSPTYLDLSEVVSSTRMGVSVVYQRGKLFHRHLKNTLPKRNTLTDIWAENL